MASLPSSGGFQPRWPQWPLHRKPLLGMMHPGPRRLTRQAPGQPLPQLCTLQRVPEGSGDLMASAAWTECCGQARAGGGGSRGRPRAGGQRSREQPALRRSHSRSGHGTEGDQASSVEDVKWFIYRGLGRKTEKRGVSPMGQAAGQTWQGWKGTKRQVTGAPWGPSQHSKPSTGATTSILRVCPTPGPKHHLVLAERGQGGVGKAAGDIRIH
jgi:hypothetical protein